MKFWNEWSGGAYDWFDPSQFINNYDIIEDVQLTDREKRLIKDDGI